MASQAKGNPAGKRMSNPNRKARRARSWAAGQQHKAQRVAEQEARAQANRQRRARGEATPWELARQARAERRSNDHQVTARRQSGVFRSIDNA